MKGSGVPNVHKKLKLEGHWLKGLHRVMAAIGLFVSALLFCHFAHTSPMH